MRTLPQAESDQIQPLCRAKELFTRSTLPLFVFRILADDPDNAFALDDFALVANRLHGSSNFHLLLLS